MWLIISVITVFVLLVDVFCDNSAYEFVYSNEDGTDATTDHVRFNALTKEPLNVGENDGENVKSVDDEEAVSSRIEKFLYLLSSNTHKLWVRLKEGIRRGIQRLGVVIKEMRNYVKNETIAELKNITRSTFEELVQNLKT